MESENSYGNISWFLQKFYKGFVVIFWDFFLQQTEWEQQKCLGLRPGHTLESTNLSAQVVFSAYSPVAIPFGHPEIVYGKIQTLSKSPAFLQHKIQQHFRDLGPGR